MSSTAPSVRGPYAKTARVRRRILDACTEVFAETGYRATTMKEIAERAGISEGGLAHHFASKSELLTAVLERREEEAAGQLAGARGLAALLAMVDIVKDDSRKPGIVELHSTLAAEAISSEHPAHEHYKHRYHSVRRYAELAFEALQREGELVSSLAPFELASAYVALSDGLQLQWLYEPDAIDVDQTLRRFLASVVARLSD
ncbi:AcrR family transcriptional regulator [Microbacterium phyllosphaerae]|uniref:AcrR family transcriptional regulator n=1 Tax=Microbacterium phyllosphaerae TaxID=124798 RepID=A0ABS4WKW7_9MICO|nr:TetR/AcrR family transcriptional regulator [Microbacterium phyllosphaerae]MBP2376840.1 AcrR family transcriptional regulator [Microbacterium phyllosphaerae]